MNKRSTKTRPEWARVEPDWRTHKRPSDFNPLLTFANTNIQEGSWADALWHAMDKERFCTVTYLTRNGAVKKTMRAPDIMRNVSTDIGIGWSFKNEDRDKVTRTIEEAITEIKHDLPKIFAMEASFELTRQLQDKVKQVLDCIIAKTDLVDRQRGGEEEITWGERLRRRDVGYKLTGQLTDLSDPPWGISHFEEEREIIETIKTLFGASDTRRAVIQSTGFVCFDDEGEDAARTLSWMLLGLADIVFQRQRPILRKCHCCENYFFHETLKMRKFCTDLCRYDSYNKRQRGEVR